MKTKASGEKLNDNLSLNEDHDKKKREITIALEMYTKIMKKEENDKCICHPIFDAIDNKVTFYENEMIAGIRISANEENQIKFDEIISNLKVMGYPITGSLISIYSTSIDDYIYLGADPLDSSLVLDRSEFDNLNFLKIKIVAFIEEKILINQTYFGTIYDENKASSGQKNGIEIKKMNSQGNKRTKERKIGYIIEKVNTWRKYYNGYYDDKGNFTKFSLDEAAKKIGISKKSLDDYLLQLRLGRKYGFDFNLHKDDKVGILRAFVKDNRKKNIDDRKSEISN